MLRLFGLVAVAVSLWSGWWFLGARGTEAGLRHWLDERRAAGWLAEAGEIRVGGYPLRFMTEVTALELADPATGLAWSAPSFRLDSPAWDPTAVTAIWPARQIVATPQERIEIAASGMEATLALVPGPALTLRHANLALAEASLDSTLGWQSRLALARLSFGRRERGENRYDLSFEAAEYEPAAPLLALIDPAVTLPRQIDLLSVVAVIGFDAPWDRQAIERRRPQPRSVDLERLKARWGRLELEAAGAVTVDAEGVPEGRVQIRAVNWRDMVALGVAAGLIPESVAGSIETGLELLAAAGGNPATIEVPLGFRGGKVTLGPVPLGAAPKLVLR